MIYINQILHNLKILKKFLNFNLFIYQFAFILINKFYKMNFHN